MITKKPKVGDHVYETTTDLVHKIRNVSASWPSDKAWSAHCMSMWIIEDIGDAIVNEPVSCLGCIGA